MTQARRPSLLVLIRHGESLRNALKCGMTYYRSDEVRESAKGIADHDIPLVDNGWRQARETGAEFKQRYGVPDYVYFSGYRRTEETMNGLLEAYTDDERAQMQIRMHVGIRERDPGFAYDMTEPEARLAFPWLKEYWQTFGGFMARPPGGESLCDVVQRCEQFLTMLFRRRAGQKVVLVTHGGTIRCLRFILEKQTIQQATAGHGPKNCGLTVYEQDSVGKLKLTAEDLVLWK